MRLKNFKKFSINEKSEITKFDVKEMISNGNIDKFKSIIDGFSIDDARIYLRYIIKSGQYDFFMLVIGLVDLENWDTIKNTGLLLSWAYESILEKGSEGRKIVDYLIENGHTNRIENTMFWIATHWLGVNSKVESLLQEMQDLIDKGKATPSKTSIYKIGSTRNNSYESVIDKYGNLYDYVINQVKYYHHQKVEK